MRAPCGRTAWRRGGPARAAGTRRRVGPPTGVRRPIHPDGAWKEPGRTKEPSIEEAAERGARRHCMSRHRTRPDASGDAATRRPGSVTAGSATARQCRGRARGPRRRAVRRTRRRAHVGPADEGLLRAPVCWCPMSDRAIERPRVRTSARDHDRRGRRGLSNDKGLAIVSTTVARRRADDEGRARPRHCDGARRRRRRAIVPKGVRHGAAGRSARGWARHGAAGHSIRMCDATRRRRRRERGIASSSSNDPVYAGMADRPKNCRPSTRRAGRRRRAATISPTPAASKAHVDGSGTAVTTRSRSYVAM